MLTGTNPTCPRLVGTPVACDLISTSVAMVQLTLEEETTKAHRSVAGDPFTVCWSDGITTVTIATRVGSRDSLGTGRGQSHFEGV
jgi:hypothetical protein